ncbi:MAG TPA: SulP family inorganic anion transporter [Ruminococcus sp.]|mgnify:FL=1|nr:SulP family inorganic anion transporter [Ruminococcus sp.]
MRLKGMTKGAALKDIFTGIIIALVSIPISMGYAQVAGLPAAYGLYGSIFPILIFGLLSTSPQFIFGVDAAPAALVGAFLVSAGIEAGSEDAVRIVPMVTFFVGLWLMLLRVLRAGRVVTYISTPVMGGFISGISATIIFMQIPKMLGGTSGSGEIVELLAHIYVTCTDSFNLMSLILGGSSLFILLLSKKLFPKLPMSVFVMAAGAAIGFSGFADRYDVAKLSAISRGLPAWKLPEMDFTHMNEVLTTSLTVAVVIMAETLLASNNMANKNGYRINNDREITVYSLGNMAACLVGCCPVNGSVSRSSMGEQYGGRSQLMSVAASVSMIMILLFGTGFIQYLPVPVLTAIVISALLGAVEFELMGRLFRQDRRELFIFFAAFFGVLVFGTVYGVMIGVVLSFISVIINTANPKRSFLGVIPGHEGFHSLERNTYAIPLKNAVVYRFSGNLYFANIGIFADDIESALTDDTRCVVVDSGAICNIDITSADKIASLRKMLAGRGISLYFASHIGQLNDRFRQLGLADLVEKGCCRRTIPAALLAAGIDQPYVLTENDIPEDRLFTAGDINRLEFEWAFGTLADDEYERYAEKLLAELSPDSDPETQLSEVIGAEPWDGISEPDQEELLEHIQVHLRELAEKLGIAPARIEEAIERRKLFLAERIARRNPEALEAIREHDAHFEERLREHDPKVYEMLLRHRREALKRLRESAPEYIPIIESFYGKSDHE